MEAGFSIGLVLGWGLMLQRESRIQWVIKGLLLGAGALLLDMLHSNTGLPAAWGMATAMGAQALFLMALRQRSMDHG